MKTVAFHNLGCKVNDYETDIMQQNFKENGFLVVPFTQKADVYVINTCTVTNIADRKSRQMIHRAKKTNPEAVVIAVGCYVQTAGKEVLKDECIDIAIGNNKKADILNILNEYIKENRPASFGSIIDINQTSEYESMFLTHTADRTRAYIKIQDGCNQFCTYCLIPFARGRARSRDEESILKEIEGLTKEGYKEFVLTGIHVSSYGVSGTADFKDNKLADLLEAINKLPGVKRIRLSSLEPRVVTEEFAKRISKLEKLCPHFHLSLQSGCDETLKRMNRHYTSDEFLSGVKLLRKYFDDPAITTDIIAGFPGETEEEFEKCFDFAKEVSFYEMHIFKYSRRKGTVADKMPGQVKDEIKEQRSHRLITLRDELSKQYRARQIGKVKPVLFEEEITVNGKKYLTGHTPEYVKVAVEASDAAANEIFDVSVDDFLSDELMAGSLH
ncbi:MAG: tRNA (N(6)-L-threonylcarbamoyladenosine(37)-C(2))-methylthiotransferase MtaB [Lachnospiraceae bacterium]|nr:tRNA (N(6)-L-threonylcarbamoyladenosine(37)-C(2))-methylthiotransferase MtaB [Lachnospiraceae bacterium]